MRVCFAIPARLNSNRIERKMLQDFDGKPLIRHVFDRVFSWGFPTVVVTDSIQIQSVIPDGKSILTDLAENGTMRLSQLNWHYDHVINIQGDMIDIEWETVEPVYNNIEEFQCITAYTPGADPDDVKVIHDFGKALWFTRQDVGYGDRHLGIYGYSKSLLDQYKKIIDKYPQENLEQNRILGFTQIGVIKTKYNGIEINTKKDIDRWIMQRRK